MSGKPWESCAIGGGLAVLHHGDCLDVVPSLAPVSHVISDPPYEDELHDALDRKDSDLGFDGINAIRDRVAEDVVLASEGWAILFTLAEDVRAWRDALQAHRAKFDTTLAWIKPDSRPRFNGQGAARGFECMVTAWCGRGFRSWNGGGRRGVFTHLCNGPRSGGHPTEKPVGLMTDLVMLYTQPGGVILDPFMGSGTTGVAALKNGRRFIGVERDPEWFAAAQGRIADEVARVAANPELFAPQTRPKQLSIEMESGA